MIEGKQIIGFESSADGDENFQSVNPALGTKLDHHFYKATPGEVNKAVEKAAFAFQVYRKKPGREKADFLESIANEIMALGDELIDICCTETALPRGRIEGERMRTVNQFKLFAELLRDGSWVNARIETALPDRTPLPKPDIRFMHIPLGTVVVFGASNFPLAFSVAGGDTASALAAGCPVIVKAHSAHPGTSELVGRAIQKATKAANMPDGVFSLLFGDGSVVGTQLVKHPHVKAVGFTGSYKGGKALFDAAVTRETPIPVYAEMGSTNPVFILPEAMQQWAEKIAQGFSGSVTLGVGQFCTNPGMLIYENANSAKEFTKQLESEFKKTSGGAMLAENIFNSYTKGIAHHSAIEGIELLANGNISGSANTAQPVLFKTSSATFAAHSELAEEIFGPTSVVVEANSKEEILTIAKDLSGHLTATVHGTENDLVAYKDLLDILEQKVGRILINGFPTGVEVCHSMVHGGPFPATTDSRSTSVGTASIYRFTRPVCYQALPDELLPAELKNENPLNIWRLVNGEFTKKVTAV
ncbi:MAG: aldehyde dehydrogenase (NADP(+)) [Ginsengibacter sp.]